MRGRDAVDTIKGYFYQFNKSILEIINLKDDSSQVIIEGVEDIDLKNKDNDIFIQCKYYSGQEYNHSEIKNAIIMFFLHFISNKEADITYHLYANFKSGQYKLPDKLDLEFVKKNFLTYTKNKVKHVVYEENLASTQDIEKFINKLDIDITAPDFEQLEYDVINSLKNISDLDQNLLDFYFLQAGSIIKKLATSKKISDRTISKKSFIHRLLDVDEKVDQWYILKIGCKKYYSMMRKKYFTTRNVSPHERFFIIDCSLTNNIHILKNIVCTISQKWSILSQRAVPPFCPYIVFYNINEDLLLNLKQELFDEKFYFIDGYCFKGSGFNINALFIEATFYNKIKIKFIEPDKLIDFLEKNTKTKLLYQFYINDVIFSNEKYNCINIKVDNIDDILLII